MKEKLFFTIVYLFLFVSGNAQEANSAVGGDCTGSGGTVSYSVGQVFYTTIIENSGAVLQGVQQPFDLLIVSLHEEPGLQLSIQVYPNPTEDYLILKIDSDHLFDASSFQYQMFDMMGKLILYEKISEQESMINVNGLAPANYILKILHDLRNIKTFKIILN